MSTTVDKRVVEMKFDNKDFEKNVQVSLGTLRNLNKALDETSSGKSLQGLERSVKNVDLSYLSNSVDQLNSRFSTLGIIGMTALMNITNMAMNAGKKIVSSMIGPITQGGFNRALNLENARFALQGLLQDAAKVEAVMKDVNYGVSDTAYSLDAAAKVAASMVASGIQAGDQMKVALRGVSGVAAMTNSTYEDIGQIFTTIAGQSKLMTYQLRQFETRGMNVAANMAKYFNEVNSGMRETTDTVRTKIQELTGGLKISEAQLREFVTQGKIDFEIFSQAMDDLFGEHAKEANNTFQGALSNMKAALARTGAMFAGPYLDNARYFFNTIRLMVNEVNKQLQPFADSVGKVMTKVREAFTGFFTGVDKDGKTVLTGYMDKYIQHLVLSFRLMASSVANIVAPISNAFQEAFGGRTANNMVKFSEGMVRVTHSFYEFTAKVAPKVKDTFKGLFDVFKLFSDVLTSIARALFPTMGPVSGLLDIFLSFTATLGRAATTITTFLRSNEKIVKVFNSIARAIRIASVVVTYFAGEIAKVISQLPLADVAVGALGIVFGTVATAIAGVVTAIKYLASNGLPGLINVLNKIKLVAAQLVNTFLDLPIINKLAQALNPVFEAIKTKVMALVEVFQRFGVRILDFFGELGHRFKEGGIVGAIEFIREQIAELFKTLKQAGEESGVINFLRNFTEEVKTMAKEITPGKLAAMAFTAVFIYMGLQIASTVRQIGEGIQNIGGFFKSLKKSLFGSVQKRLITAVAESILMLAVSLKVISTIPEDALLRSAIVIGIFCGAIIGMGVIIGVLSKFKGGFFLTIQSIAASFIAFSVAVGILVIALNGLTNLENMEARLGALITISTVFGILAVVIGRLAPKFTAGALGLVGMAFALGYIIDALSNLKFGVFVAYIQEVRDNFKLAAEELVAYTAVISFAIVGIMAVASALSNCAKNLAIGLLGLMASMIIFIKITEYLANADFKTHALKKVGIYLGAFILIMGIFSLLAKSKDGGGMKGVAASLLALSLALTVMVGLTAILSMMEWETIGKGLVFLGGIIVTLGYLFRQAGKVQNSKGVGTLVVTIGALVGLFGEMIVLTLIPWEDLLVASGAMAAVMVSFAVVLKEISKTRFKAEQLIAMIAVVSAMFVIGKGLAELSQLPWQCLLSAAAAMSLTLMAFAGAIRIVSSGKIDTSTALGMAIGVAAMVTIGIALNELSSIPWQNLLAATVAISATLLAFSASMLIISKIETDATHILTLMAAVTAMVAVGITLWRLSLLDWQSMLAATVAISATMLALAAFMHVMANIETSADTFLNIVVSLLSLFALAQILPMLADSLNSFATIQWDTILKSAAIILVFTAALYVLSSLDPSILLAAAGAILIVAMSMGIAAISLNGVATAFNNMVPAFQAFAALPLLEMAAGLVAVAAACVMLSIGGILLLPGGAGITLASVGLALLADAVLKFDASGGGATLKDIASGVLYLAAAGLTLYPVCPALISAGLAMLALGNGVAQMAGGILTEVATGMGQLAISIKMLEGGVMSQVAQDIMQMNMAMMMANVTITTFTMQLMRLGPICVQVGQNVSTGLANGITQGAENARNAASTTATSVLDKFRTIFDTHSPSEVLKGIGRAICQGLGIGIGETEGAAVGAAGQVANAVKAKFMQLLDWIKGIIKGIGQAISTITGGMIDFGNAFEGVDFSGVGLDVNALTNEFVDLDAILGDTGIDIETLAGATGEAGDAAAEATGDVEGLDGALSNLGGGGGGAGQATNALKELTSTIASQMDIFSEFNRKAEISADQMLNNMRSQINGVREWANNMQTLAARGISQGLLEQLAQLGPQGYEKVAAFVQMTDEQLREANDLYAASLVLPASAAAQVIGSYGLTGQNAAQSFVAGYDPGIASQAGLAFATNVDRATRDGLAIASPSKVMMEIGQFTVQGFVLGIKRYTSTAVNVVRAFSNSIIRAMSDGLKPSIFEDIGKNVVSGLILGIDSMRGALMQKVSEMSALVTQGFQNALQVYSPSRFTMWLGEMLMLGLGNGIVDGATDTVRTIDDVSDDIKSAMQSTMSYIYDALSGNLDLNPVITPQIDLSNVLNGANRINGLFESRRIHAFGNVDGTATNGVDSTNGRSVQFIQNNYSPKALSRVEIYRQTKNQFSQARSVLAGG